MIQRVFAKGRAEGWLQLECTLTDESPENLLREIAARLANSHPRVAPLDWARERLDLDETMHHALWMLASIELDPLLTRAISPLTDGEVSIQLLQQLVEAAGDEPLTTTQLERLLRMGLVEANMDPRVSTARRAVRASDRVLELVGGKVRLDAEVATFAELLPHEACEEISDVPTTIANALKSTNALLIITGQEGSGRGTILRNVLAEIGVGALEVDCHKLDLKSLDRQLRAIARECGLFGVAPLFRGIETLVDDPERRQRFERDLLPLLACPIVGTAVEMKPWKSRRTIVVHELEAIQEAARRSIWTRCLPGTAPDVIDEAASRYAIVPGAIVAAAKSAAVIAGGVPSVKCEHIHAGLRSYLDQRLGSLAKRVEYRQTWDDLVLPTSEFEQLFELVARVKNRKRVLEDWGFADKVGKGFGVTALFSGPPGTGKTMVAGLVAAELGLDLYQVDLSRVVSKYIGETEKNLSTLFDAAESGHSILLFDEADSLFAKRTEVKSSNDRNANLEVNYLLQRMESFRGITLLTTNHETALDPAFRRRISLHIRFPTPDADQRTKLWEAMFPHTAEIGPDVDILRLAQKFAMSGGYIKNAVMRAAYLAADGGQPISMQLLWRAAELEYESMGKLPSAA